jgi:histidine triad (HIT) family protein
MATVFTRVLSGELPGRFVWRDGQSAAFLTVNPLRPGHTLVVPVQEVDHWLDLEPALAQHLMVVAQKVGRGIAKAFEPKRVGLLVAGLEVPHVHLHVVGIDDVHDLDFDRQERDPDPAALDDAADRLRRALVALGHPEAGGLSG